MTLVINVNTCFNSYASRKMKLKLIVCLMTHLIEKVIDKKCANMKFSAFTISKDQLFIQRWSVTILVDDSMTQLNEHKGIYWEKILNHTYQLVFSHSWH